MRWLNDIKRWCKQEITKEEEEEERDSNRTQMQEDPIRNLIKFIGEWIEEKAINAISKQWTQVHSYADKRFFPFKQMRQAQALERATTNNQRWVLWRVFS